MSSSGLAYCTIYCTNFSDGFFRIFNSNKFKSEKHKEISNHSKIYYMKLIFITIVLISVPNISLGNAIWTLFILDITLSDYLNLLGYIKKISNFMLSVIQIARFFKNLNIFSSFSIFSLLFPRKELKTTKKLSKITKKKTLINKIITLSSIIVQLLFIIHITCFEKLYQRKQQLSLLKEVAKFLKNHKNYPIVPLLSFRLNINEIICNVGLGCESESIGVSFVHRSLWIILCFNSSIYIK